MIPVGFGIGTVAAVVVGSLALGAVLITPPPPPPASVWLDEPVNAAELAPGGSLVNIHASSAHRIVQFRVIVSAGSEVVTVLNDTTPDAVTFGNLAVPLTSGSMQWKPKPGTYVLTPSYLDSSDWTTGNPITVTISDGDFLLPSGPAPIPLPGQTAEPTEDPTVPPEEPIDPTQPDPGPAATVPPSQPAPSATPTTPPSTPAAPPTGTVRRQVTGTTTTFIAEGVSPQNAVVDVQVQITNDYNGPANPSGSWTSLGCGTLTAQSGTSPTKYTCTTATWNGPGQSSSFRTGHVRVVITSAGGTVTVYGSNWLIDAHIA